MKADRETSVATALVVATMARGMPGDAWRYMTAREWARRER